MRTYLQIGHGRVTEINGEVVREQPVTVHVDGRRFLTLLCSPFQLEALVLGFLWMERVIDGLADVAGLSISEVDGRADVSLTRPVDLPTERILTSGCGGGTTFRIDPRLFSPLRSSLRVRPGDLAARLKDLFAAAGRYRASRGIHGACLTDGARLVVVAEDVGRHNAVDKAVGALLRRGLVGKGPGTAASAGLGLLAVSGRTSFEIVQKAAAAGVPVVASVSAPSSLAVDLAGQAGIALLGFVRGGRLNVYANAWRIEGAEADGAAPESPPPAGSVG